MIKDRSAVKHGTLSFSRIWSPTSTRRIDPCSDAA